jgi:hypothetical protein
MPNDMAGRLKDKEDSYTERKPAGVHDRDIRRTLVAFANSLREDKTAVLFVGISDDGTVHGVTNVDKLQKTIDNICNEQCYPPLSYKTEVLKLGAGKEVLAVEILPDLNLPHFSGQAYVRQGTKSVEASEELFKELLATRNSKAGFILKWKGKIITVTTKHKKLGDPTPLDPRDYLSETRNCEVVECTPFFVRLRDDKYYTEPLNNITITLDEKQSGRLMLIVEPK